MEIFYYVIHVGPTGILFEILILVINSKRLSNVI